MSWIQENKFTAALAGVTTVGSIALISLAMGKGDDLATAKTKLKKALRNEVEIQSVQPFPNKENLEKKKSIVSDYTKGASDLQRQFAAYRPKAKDVEDFAPDKFSAIVSSYRNRLNRTFKKNGVELPDQCVYGFEAYASKFPRPEATGELSYQVKAIEWLLTKLARNEPEALLNVVRSKFDLELAPIKVEMNKGLPAKTLKEPEYYAMPLELSFRCDEKGLSNFLAEIANTDKYAFVIRSLHIQNERMTPPTQSDAEFAPATPEVADNAFGFGFGADFVIQGDDVANVEDADAAVVQAAAVPANAAVPVVGDDSDNTRKLLPVLGSEKINVFLKLDLILLSQSADLVLDEVEAAAKIKSSSSAR